MNYKILLYILLSIACSEMSFAQSNDLFIPRNVQKALTDKTRSLDGKPGSNYWQNRSDYVMDIAFDPATRLLKGKEKITYFNNSPDTLRDIYVHLYPNFFKKGIARDFSINLKDEGDGVEIEKITYQGKVLSNESGKHQISYNGTLAILKLESPLLPKTKAELTFDWNYVLCKAGGVRTGTIDSTSFFVAYFFPHIAVYDDIDGWNDFQYTGGVEFYNDFSNFDVSITVPKNYTVHASGELLNPSDVLSQKYVKRYKEALISDKIINIIDSNDIAGKDITTQNDKNTWKYKAVNITDFAFGLSDHYLWDGSGLVVNKSTGRRVFIDAVYNKNSKDYYQVAKTARDEINYMSNVLPGYPFPFPKETVFNGVGGMEYPMMVNDSSVPDSDMVGLAAHEISHSYFPFFMGINESKHAWMDEGWAAYIDYMTASALYNIQLIKNSRVAQYKKAIGTDADVPIIVDSRYLKSPV
ncbi:MAG: M1 family metallopeptidase [Bacteroidota bacterium]|nr:M1 family metallopeptidase [Bacteroidota bacterium]